MTDKEESKERLLYRLSTTYCRLKPSLIAKGGVGVFAIRDIPAGTVLFQDAPESFWHELTTMEEQSLDPAVIDMVKDFFHLSKDGRREIPSLGVGNLSILYYLNHSIRPNMEIVEDEDEDEDEDEGEEWLAQPCVFKTIRRIKAGEELCYDYGTVLGAVEQIR